MLTNGFVLKKYFMNRAFKRLEKNKKKKKKIRKNLLYIIFNDLYYLN